MVWGYFRGLQTQNFKSVFQRPPPVYNNEQKNSVYIHNFNAAYAILKEIRIEFKHKQAVSNSVFVYR